VESPDTTDGLTAVATDVPTVPSEADAPGATGNGEQDDILAADVSASYSGLLSDIEVD
jgi:hypothetical protein